MRQLFVILAVCVTLSGCASSPLDKIPDLANKDLGDVTAILNNQDRVDADETQKLRHWKYSQGYFVKDVGEGAIQATKLRLIQVKPYCAALGGNLSEPVYETFANSITKIESLCSRKSDGAALFRVAMGYEVISVYKSRAPQQGACVWPMSDNPIYRENNVSSETYPVLCRAWFDAFQWKTSGISGDVEDQYKVGAMGFDTISNVDMQLQRRKNFLEQQQQAQLREIKMRIQLNEQEQARLRERALRDLPQVKSVGQKICRTVEITQRKVLGYAMGKPLYGVPSQQQAHITAFTENVSESKIQIRVSGIQANGENIKSIDGDVVIENGAVIWDEAANWGLCY